MFASLKIINKLRPTVADDSEVCTSEFGRTYTLYSLIQVTPGTEKAGYAVAQVAHCGTGFERGFAAVDSWEVFTKRDAEHRYSQMGSKRLSVQVSNA
jgi:hypothetical protein